MIDRETIDRIYAAVNIVDIVGDYVTLRRKGVNYEACCPFHNEKTPSFKVSPARGIYKCFGCGKSGNAVNFIMESESVSYPEALRMLAKRYGIDVREEQMTEEERFTRDSIANVERMNAEVYHHGSTLYAATQGSEEVVTIENEFMSVAFNNLGGKVADVTLKNYTR